MGIVGLGNIGSKVAAIAKAFGMNVSYFSTSGTSHNSDYPSLPLEEMLASSDVVSIHAPLNERTMGLIGAGELALMKPGAYLINMGRGGIVDEAALAEAVDNGVIAGAALDVFLSEPLPLDSPFLKMQHPERMRLAPHVAWASVEARSRLVGMIAENIRTFSLIR
jgi:glycerate dehydrogenase